MRSVLDLTSEERERLSIRPEDAPAGRDCSVSLEPAPALVELVDSAALHADLVRHWPDDGESVEPAGRAVFTVDVDSLGNIDWMDVHSSNLPDTTLALVSSLFPDRVTARIIEGEDGPGRSGWTFRLGVDIGPTPALEVSRPVYCLPRLRNPEQVRAKLNALVNLQGLDINDLGQTTVLWMRPDADGRPQRMQVSRSSGSPTLDMIAQHAAADALFHPATADGHPLEVWVSLPINFTAPPRRERK